MEGHIIARGLEHRKRLGDELGKPVGLSLGLDIEPGPGLHDSPAELTYAIAGGGSPLGERDRPLERLVASPDLEQNDNEVVLRREVELALRCERNGALEEAQGGAEVLSANGSTLG